MSLDWGNNIVFRYFMIIIVTLGILQAEEYKAVFDCSSDNASYIKSRMWLVGKTLDMIEKKGDTAKFVITLHGGCVSMVSKLYDEIVDEADEADIKKAQEYLGELVKKKKVKVIACAMSLNANAIETKEVLPFVVISDNSFIDTIYYQNRGYALMTFK